MTRVTRISGGGAVDLLQGIHYDERESGSPYRTPKNVCRHRQVKPWKPFIPFITDSLSSPI